MPNHGYLYNPGTPLDSGGQSLKYPHASLYDVYVPTLRGLKAIIQRDIGYLPNWLHDLNDPAEYLQVEEEVHPMDPKFNNMTPDLNRYTGQVLYIEGAEVEKDEDQDVQ
jgi:hypothetical protein